jgi:hypothetical protein
VAVPAKPSQSSDVPDEVGVYQVLPGKLVAIEPEIVNWRTGGVVKNAVTLGLDKGHVNGTVAGPHSKFNVNSVPFGMAGPLEFYIRCLEGNSASEYQLLRFWEKNDHWGIVEACFICIVLILGGFSVRESAIRSCRCTRSKSRSSHRLYSGNTHSRRVSSV